MKSARLLVFIAILVAYSNVVLAHPIHDTAGSLFAGLAHPFLGADHLLALVAVGIWAACLGRTAWQLVPPVFLLGMLGGGAFGAMGLSLPGVEPIVASSVLALGLLITMQLRLGRYVAAALVGVFAVFHGVVHVVESPHEVSALGYVAGFVLSSAGLLLIGFEVGARLAARPGLARLAGLPVVLAGCALVARALL